MEILAYLIPISLLLGGLGLAGFWWTIRGEQYDDPEGDARRILDDAYDDRPKPEPPATGGVGEKGSGTDGSDCD